MSHVHTQYMTTDRIPAGSAISVLVKQHGRIRDMFAAVRRAHGDGARELFDDLREMLAVHEAGEEMVLRPISRTTAGPRVVSARDQEEAEISLFLAGLEQVGTDDPRFGKLFDRLEQAFLEHSAQEEATEFPTVLADCDEEDQLTMGLRLAAAQHLAPTHPHPEIAGSTAKQYTVGPFASLLDRARDMFRFDDA
jgi:hypothetical protein